MNKLLKRVDIIIIVVLLVGSALFIGFFFLSKNHCTIAVIEKDGKIINKINLNSVAEPYTINIDDSIYPVTLNVEHGKISFINSKCPDKLCEKTGKIFMPKQTAICLPARVCVHIEGEYNEFDSITG